MASDRTQATPSDFQRNLAADLDIATFQGTKNGASTDATWEAYRQHLYQACEGWPAALRVALTCKRLLVELLDALETQESADLCWPVRQAAARAKEVLAGVPHAGAPSGGHLLDLLRQCYTWIELQCIPNGPPLPNVYWRVKEVLNG